MSLADLLINTCTVLRYDDGGIDDYGHPVKEWGDHLTEQPCRLMSTSGREINTGTEIVLANYKLFLPVVDVTERDRIVLNTVTYEVLLVSHIQDGSSAHHLECDLQVVR